MRLCPDRVEEGDRGVFVSDGRLRSTFASPPLEREVGPAGRGPVTLVTGAPIVDATWRLALQEIESLRRTASPAGGGPPVTRLNAGESWAQAWTRDSSFAADLGLVLVFPEEARASLDASTDRLVDVLLSLRSSR